MSNLTKEAIEAIEETNCFANEQKADAYRMGADQALTNPTIYQSAGLMSVEEALRFAKHCKHHTKPSVEVTTDLLTIFRNQKEVK